LSDLGYHYHAIDPGKNQIIGCFRAEYGCALERNDQIRDASTRPARDKRRFSFRNALDAIW
jgi:hypothetical protein